MLFHFLDADSGLLDANTCLVPPSRLELSGMNLIYDLLIIIIIIIIRQFIRHRNMSKSLQVQGRRTTSNANTWGC